MRSEGAAAHLALLLVRQDTVCTFFRLVHWFYPCRPLLEIDLLALLYTEILRFDLHLHPLQSAALPGAVYFRGSSGSSFWFSGSAFSKSSTARTGSVALSKIIDAFV